MTAIIPAYFNATNTPNVMNVLFGLFAIQVAMQGGPATMPQPCFETRVRDAFVEVRRRPESGLAAA